VRAVRLSYVGEPGWELTCRAADALRLYDALHEAGARPAGLYAQTSMRIEKRYLAMGHDLDADVTPVEAGLEFAVAWDKPFIGRDALLRRCGQTAATRLVTIVLDDAQAVPLGQEPVLRGGRIIGKTSSAAFGYRVGRPVALAYVETAGVGELAGLRVEIDIAGSRFEGTVTLAAAFDPEGALLRGTTAAGTAGPNAATPGQAA